MINRLAKKTRQIAKGKTKMASFFDDEAEVGTTDDEDEMETEGTLKVRKFFKTLKGYDQK